MRPSAAWSLERTKIRSPRYGLQATEERLPDQLLLRSSDEKAGALEFD
jgi:hypothetical protein